jgi:uncharacterized OB-fold protein
VLGRLVFKKCLNGAHIQFPPRYLCPKCWSDQAEWITSSGEGRVYSFTIVHRSPTPAFTGNVPYVLAMIEVREGPRMVANIVGDGALDVSIGDAVIVAFEQRDTGVIPQFRRVLR